jgi:hypothetical protein
LLSRVDGGGGGEVTRQGSLEGRAESKVIHSPLGHVLPLGPYKLAREGNNTEGPVPPRATFSLHGPACLGLGRPNGTAAAKRGGVMQCVVVRWSGRSNVAIEASLGSGDGLWHQFRGSVVGVVGRGGDDFAHRRSSRGEGGGPAVSGGEASRWGASSQPWVGGRRWAGLEEATTGSDSKAVMGGNAMWRPHGEVVPSCNGSYLRATLTEIPESISSPEKRYKPLVQPGAEDLVWLGMAHTSYCLVPCFVLRRCVQPHKKF